MPETISPHNTDAERALLGAALVNPACIPSTALIVQVQDFFIVRHRWIWEALLAMLRISSAIDLVTTCEQPKALPVDLPNWTIDD